MISFICVFIRMPEITSEFIDYHVIVHYTYTSLSVQ